MSQIARIRDTAQERRLQAERLIGPEALREAQALRFRVFSDELKATLKGAEGGLDQDDFDRHCAHIGVRDLNTGHLVATTRLLDHTPRAASGIFTAKKNSICTGWRTCKGLSLKSDEHASTPPTAMAAPLPYCGANWLKCSIRATTDT